VVVDSGRSALVLGGSGGIGSAVVRHVARNRAVLMTTWRRQERAVALASELDRRPSPVQVLRADATTDSGVAGAFDAAAALGELDIVVDCVGAWDYTPLRELEVDAMDAALALNLRSALLVLRHAAHRVSDGGRVVLISSAAVSVAPARQLTYVAAKAGVEAAARVAAKELAPRGVTVNVVRPGATDTETLREGTAERAVEAMARSNAMRRLGTPDDIASVVDLALSADAGWMTGAVLDATGGLL
jgi:3-oxoacyl-[acyl-carrier protein] reductase